MSEHTKEPWAVCKDAPNYYWYVGRSIESVPIGSRIADTCVLDANAKENARRIVACVNACADIPTEWLEVNEIAPHVATCGLNQHEAEKERDELRTKNAQLELALKQKEDACKNGLNANSVLGKNEYLREAITIQPSQEALNAFRDSIYTELASEALANGNAILSDQLISKCTTILIKG